MQVVLKPFCTKLLPLLLLLVLANATVYGQTAYGNTKNKRQTANPADTVIITPASITLRSIENCLKGITEVVVEQNFIDSASIPKWLYVYVLPDFMSDIDSAPGHDSLYLHTVFSYAEIVRNNHRLYVDVVGRYYVIPALGKQSAPVFGKPSNIVNVHFCSKIDFPSVFDKALQKVYSPGPFINIQIAEFDIFDRMGNAAYSHKNNDINWDGNYPSQQPCTPGVYYYHCSYIDLSDGSGTKKSLSGMIELKN